MMPMTQEVLGMALLFIALSTLVLIPWPRQGGLLLALRLLLPALFLLSACLVGALVATTAASGQSPLDPLMARLALWRAQLFSLPPLLDPLRPLLDEGLRLLAEGLLALKNLLVSPLQALFGLGLAMMGGYGLLRLVLAAVAGLISLALGLLRWIWRSLKALLGRPSQAPTAQEGLSARQRFLIPSLFATLICLGLALAFLPYWAAMPPLDGYFSSLFWIGSWVMALEIGSLLKAGTDEERGALQVSAEPAEARTRVGLEQLFNAYKTTFNPFLLKDFQQPPEALNPSRSEREPVTLERARGLFGRVFPKAMVERMLPPLADYLDGKDLLFVEDLTQAHILLCSELIMDSLNHKGPVLVLCPDGSADAVEAAFQRAFADHYLKVGYRVHREEQIRDPGQEADLFIYSLAGLESFLARPLPEGISLLLVLEFQSLDLALLRHELARLWLKLDQGGVGVRKLFQCRRLYNAEPVIRAITEQQGLGEHHLNPQGIGERFVLVWDGDRASAGLRSHYFKDYKGYLSATPLLAYLPSESGDPFRPVWADEDRRADRDQHERLENCLRKGIQCDIAAGGWTAAADEPDPVLLLEDRHNLVHALMRNPMGWQTAHLVNIICGEYLLRDLMLRQPPMARELFYPVLPRVVGGITDLARQLIRALDASDGLSQPELQRLLGLFADQRLLRENGILPSLRGVKRLLDLALGMDNVYVQCVPRGDGYLYKASVPIALRPWLSVVDDGGTLLGQWKRGDYGLTFCEGIFVLLHGKQHRVREVDLEGGQVRVLHVDNERLQPHRYRFDREYRIDGRRGPCHPGIVERPGLTLATTPLILDISRTTRGYYQLAEYDVTPATSLYWRCDPPRVFSRKWCNAIKFSFEGSLIDSLPDRPRIAFTLAVLLQDVLYSLFPFQEDHLVVLSGETPAQDAAGRDVLQAENMPLLLYPRLSETPEIQVRGRVSLYLIEDADGDLGVAQTIASGYERYFQLVLEYLRSLDGPEGGDVWRYHRFGADSLPPCFDYEGTRNLLAALLVERPADTAKPGPSQTPPPQASSPESTGQCDFCGKPLGSRFDELGDGRERCHACSQDAIEGDDIEEVREEILAIIKNMQSRYRISLPTDIHAQIVSAETLAQRRGQVFIPSEGLDPRAVGLAIMEGDQLEILIENGTPRDNFRLTVAHELTHIWQFRNAANPERLHDKELVEGQATFAMLDYGFSHGLDDAANNEASSLRNRDDEYSRGLRQIQIRCGAAAPHQLFDCFRDQLS